MGAVFTHWSHRKYVISEDGPLNPNAFIISESS